MKQPNGLPVQHVCITIGQLSRYAFVFEQALNNGCIEKVNCSCSWLYEHTMQTEFVSTTQSFEVFNLICHVMSFIDYEFQGHFCG